MSNTSGKRKWIVRTSGGDYLVFAWTANDAKRAVFYLTFGRIRESDMIAERTA